MRDFAMLLFVVITGNILNTIRAPNRIDICLKDNSFIHAKGKQYVIKSIPL